MRKLSFFIGKSFGRLTCVKYLGRHGHNNLFECLCQCGNVTRVLDANLTQGRAKSCGCWGLAEGADSINWKGFGEISASYLSTIKRGAKERGLEVSVDIEYLWNLFLEQDRKCALSGGVLFFRTSYKERYEQTASLDRIDSSKGYVKGNLQWVHKDINMMKQDYNQDYFIQTCRQISKDYDNKPSCKPVVLRTEHVLARERFLYLNNFSED